MSDEDRIRKSKKNSKKESLDEKGLLTPPEVLSIKQEITPDDLKESFPNLHAEITEKRMDIKIDDVEGGISLSDETDSNLGSDDLFSNYEPSTLDYIRRAKTDKEAEEVIHFALKQENIGSEEASNLLDQLSKKGVRSFGSVRTSGHYFRKATEARNRQLIKKRYSIPK